METRLGLAATPKRPQIAYLPLFAISWKWGDFWSMTPLARKNDSIHRAQDAVVNQPTCSAR
jgi:hypothetical protein